MTLLWPVILFWMVAAAVSAAAGGLILAVARRAEGRAAIAEDPSVAVHRRQLAEIDDLQARGLLSAAEFDEVRAEAGRRLLASADAPVAQAVAVRRWVVPAAALAAPLVAFGIYLGVGSPGLADAPMAARVARWQASDPRTLTAAEIAAVLTALRSEHPGDAKLLGMLATARMESGDPFGAAKALREAVAIRPDDPALWTSLGEAFIATSGGEVNADARQAFDQALKIDPKAAVARYHLARADIVGGNPAKGLAEWKALLADLPPDDPRRAGLAAEIAQNGRIDNMTQDEPEDARPTGPDIRAMVEGLATRLEAEPDDPEGWARLIRAYAVLGESDKQQAALASARKQFKSRPDILRRLESASEAPQ